MAALTGNFRRRLRCGATSLRPYVLASLRLARHAQARRVRSIYNAPGAPGVPTACWSGADFHCYRLARRARGERLGGVGVLADLAAHGAPRLRYGPSEEKERIDTLGGDFPYLEF